MAQTAWKTVGSAATESYSPWSDDNWVNASYIAGAGEASITSNTFDSPDQSYILKGYNCGFTTSDVPTGSTIDGVEVIVNGRYAGALVSVDFICLLDENGSRAGNNLASTPQALTTTATDYTWGSSSNRWGYTALSDTIVRSSGFGAAIGCLAGGSNGDVYIDYIKVRVTYTAPILLSVSECLNSHTAESPALTQAHTLAPATGTNVLDDDGPITLTQDHVLAVADCAHVHDAEENIVLQVVADTELVVAAATHALSSGESIPDILSESFEGTGYENTGWSESGGSGSADEDSTAHTFPGLGSQSLRINDKTVNRNMSEDPIRYGEIWFHIASESLATDAQVAIFRDYDNAWAMAWMAYFQKEAGGGLTFRALSYYDGGYHSPTFQNISTGVNYRIRWKYDSTNKSVELWLDDDLLLSASPTTVVGGLRWLYLGDINSTFNLDVDGLKISSTGWSDTLNLVENKTLAVAAAANVHAAEGPVLTQAHTLELQDAAHTHAAEAPVLTQAHTLGLQDAAHVTTSPNIDVVPGSADTELVVSPGAHVHAAASLDLTQAHTLSLDAAAHVLTSPNLTVTTHAPHNHYVDSNASAGGDGSIGTPWDTLADVNGHTLEPGDAVFLKRGSLFRESLVISAAGTATYPIYYGAYSTGDDPIICGANVISSWTLHSGNVWKATANAWDSRLVLFDGEYGYPEATLGALSADGDFYWESGEVYVYSSGGNPASAWSMVELATRPRGIWTNDTADMDYIDIEDIKIYGVGDFYGWTGYAIHNYFSDNWNIDNVTVEKSAAFGFSGTNCNYISITNSTFLGFPNTLLEWGQSGIRFTRDYTTTESGHNYVGYCTINYYAGSGITFGGYSNSYPTEYNEAAYNDVSHCASGIYPGKCNHSLIHHNTCDDNLQRRVYNEEYGLALETGQDNEWYNNIVTNGRVGIELWGFESGEPYPTSGPVDRNKVYNNFFSGNSIDAIHVYEGCSDNSEFYNNIIVGNHGGMFFFESDTTGTGNLVYNNTLYNNTGDYPNIYLGSALAGWTFRNNLCFSITDYCLNSPNIVTSSVHDHNLYYRASGIAVKDFTSEYTSAQVTNFEATAIGADPKLVNPGGSTAADYKLASDSPARDAGVSGISTDYWGSGRPWNTGYDIGAHEFDSIAPAACAHVLASASPDLTQAHTLEISASAHVHAAEATTLTQAHLLELAAAAHVHAAQVPTLTQAHTLAVAAAAHVHAAENVELSLIAILEMQTAVHVLSTQAPTLVQAHTLEIAAAAHVHTAENVTIQVTTIDLVVAAATHIHAAQTPTLTQAHTLAVADSAHVEGTGTLALTQAHTIAPADCAILHTAAGVVLVQAHVLSPAASVHGHNAQALDLTQAHTLAVAAGSHIHTGQNVSLIQAQTLAVSNAAHVHTAPNLDLNAEVVNIILNIESPEIMVYSQTPDLPQVHILTVAQPAHAVVTGSLDLIHNLTLAMNAGAHSLSSPEVTLDASVWLTMANAGHIVSSEVPVFTQVHNLTNLDSIHVLTNTIPPLGLTLSVADGTIVVESPVPDVASGPARFYKTVQEVSGAREKRAVLEYTEGLDINVTTLVLQKLWQERQTTATTWERTINHGL